MLASSLSFMLQRESFEDQHTGAGDINTDPPLAILFKRVGTGGEELSNADYVYSVIKHYVPEVHGTVEALLKDEKVSALYTPTTLVYECRAACHAHSENRGR